MHRQGFGWTPTAAVLANALILGVPLVALILQRSDSTLYYRSVQEDGFLEWMTFWSFALAAAVCVGTAVRQRSGNGRPPWFWLGVAAFCFFVAMEEISWGQRLVGYRPPEFFLRENFQQELNIHNVFSTSLRKLMLKAVILGYGVVLPLATLPKSTRRRAAQLGIDPPPATLLPAFLATFLLYEAYPLDFAGEWVELMLGLGFLFSAISHPRARPTNRSASLESRALAAGVLVACLLGAASATISRVRPLRSEDGVSTAKSELNALGHDLTHRDRPLTQCGIHKRVFSFVEKYDRDQLYHGEFDALVSQGMAEERARYFLDPWNTPIWIRHSCSEDDRHEIVFVYSFGPDRRRDSSPWQILGDDVGVVVYERGA